MKNRKSYFGKSVFAKEVKLICVWNVMLMKVG